MSKLLKASEIKLAETTAAFVPSNAADIKLVISGFKKAAKVDAKKFITDVNAVSLIAYPVIVEMVEQAIPYNTELVSGAIYEAAGFSDRPEFASDEQGKEINARKISYVAMRIKRGINAAMSAYAGRDQGYHLAPKQEAGSKILEGALLAPNNLVKKTVVDKDDQGNVIDATAPNLDTHATLVPQNSVNHHLNTLVPNSVKTRVARVTKATDATAQMDTSIQMKMDSLAGKTTGKPATSIDKDKQSLRVYLDIVASAKSLHAIALANGCDGATQYLMQCMDNAPALDAVA